MMDKKTVDLFVIGCRFVAALPDGCIMWSDRQSLYLLRLLLHLYNRYPKQAPKTRSKFKVRVDQMDFEFCRIQTVQDGRK